MSELNVKSEDQPIQGKVISPTGSPRSYVISTPSGEVHRNQSHLNIVLVSAVAVSHALV